MNASTSEANKAVIVKIFEDVYNQGRMETLYELVTDDAALHAPMLEEPLRGPGGFEQYVAEIRAAFPDVHLVIDDVIADDENVVVRWRTDRQTHLGPYHGLPPTGRSVRLTGINICHVRDGQMDECWLEFDAFGGVQQMGAIPPEGISTLGRIGFTLASFVRFARLEMRYKRGQKAAR